MLRHIDPIEAQLRRVLSTLDGGQAFVFGPAGEPFVARSKRVLASELVLLRAALDLIELREPEHPRPFLGRDSLGRFVVTALDEREDLWVVVLPVGNVAATAANLVDSRADFRPLLDDLRRQFGLR